MEEIRAISKRTVKEAEDKEEELRQGDCWNVDVGGPNHSCAQRCGGVRAAVWRKRGDGVVCAV